MKKQYLNNSIFLMYLKSCDLRKPSDSVVKCYKLLIRQILKSKKFWKYSEGWKDSMRSEAMWDLLRYGHNFSRSKSRNAFSYFTTIIHRSFFRVIRREKRKLYEKFKLFLQSPYIEELFHGSDDPALIDECGWLMREIECISADAAFEVDLSYIQFYVDRYEMANPKLKLKAA